MIKFYVVLFVRIFYAVGATSTPDQPIPENVGGEELQGAGDEMSSSGDRGKTVEKFSFKTASISVKESDRGDTGKRKSKNKQRPRFSDTADWHGYSSSTGSFAHFAQLTFLSDGDISESQDSNLDPSSDECSDSKNGCRLEASRKASLPSEPQELKGKPVSVNNGARMHGPRYVYNKRKRAVLQRRRAPRSLMEGKRRARKRSDHHSPNTPGITGEACQERSPRSASANHMPMPTWGDENYHSVFSHFTRTIEYFEYTAGLGEATRSPVDRLVESGRSGASCRHSEECAVPIKFCVCVSPVCAQGWPISRGSDYAATNFSRPKNAFLSLLQKWILSKSGMDEEDAASCPTDFNLCIHAKVDQRLVSSGESQGCGIMEQSNHGSVSEHFYVLDIHALHKRTASPVSIYIELEAVIDFPSTEKAVIPDSSQRANISDFIDFIQRSGQDSSLRSGLMLTAYNFLADENSSEPLMPVSEEREPGMHPRGASKSMWGIDVLDGGKSTGELSEAAYTEGVAENVFYYESPAHALGGLNEERWMVQSVWDISSASSDADSSVSGNTEAVAEQAIGDILFKAGGGTPGGSSDDEGTRGATTGRNDEEDSECSTRSEARNTVGMSTEDDEKNVEQFCGKGADNITTGSFRKGSGKYVRRSAGSGISNEANGKAASESAGGTSDRAIEEMLKEDIGRDSREALDGTAKNAARVNEDEAVGKKSSAAAGKRTKEQLEAGALRHRYCATCAAKTKADEGRDSSADPDASVACSCCMAGPEDGIESSEASGQEYCYFPCGFIYYNADTEIKEEPDTQPTEPADEVEEKSGSKNGGYVEAAAALLGLVAVPFCIWWISLVFSSLSYRASGAWAEPASSFEA